MSKPRGRSMAGDPLCPRPDKRGFRTEEHLRKRLSRNPEAEGQSPYKCKCGYWHMGHKKRVKANK